MRSGVLRHSLTPVRLALFTLAVCLLLGGWGFASRAAGQTDESGWASPINLSQSGAAADPQMIVDPEGVFHVIWKDTIDNTFVYVNNSEGEWSTPLPAEPPFGTRIYYRLILTVDDPTPLFTPVLIADNNGTIHAFWINEEGVLFYSSLAGEDFTNFLAWEARQKLADNVLKAAAAVDEEGRLHVSYITSESAPDLPVGLYYQQSENGGTSWSFPALLYQSAYFRLLTSDDAHVQMATAAGGNVFVTWDDRVRERVFLVRSTDSGQIWEEPQEIDKRQETDGLDSVGPSKIGITITGSNVHLTWQAGHGESQCAQYHQLSTDLGVAWRPAIQILESVSGCPEQIRFVQDADTLALMANMFTGVHLIPWVDGEWSEPQLQEALTSFVEADTFRLVNYTCGRAAIAQADKLFVANCGQGNGQDVWLTSRPLDAITTIAEATPIWNASEPLGNEGGPILSPVMLTDADDRIHAFWTQGRDDLQDTSFDLSGESISYARWNGTNWSRPTAVLAPSGREDQPAVVLDNSGQLLTVWRSGQKGEIYFSRADADRANIASEWSEPQLVSPLGAEASSPDIRIDQTGRVYVAYVISINEQRGIYLTTSNNAGEAWAEPMRVFDGVAAGWDAVGPLSMTLTAAGHIHLLWSRQTSVVSSDTAVLHYSHSTDGGKIWTEPEPIANPVTQNAPIFWSKLIGMQARIVHRIWQEWDGRRFSLWHQWSPDDGVTWERATRITGFGLPLGPASVTVDPVGQLHLLQLMEGSQSEEDTSPVLQQWLWQGDGWETLEQQPLEDITVARTDKLAAAVTSGGRMIALYSGHSNDVPASVQLYFTGRDISLPDTEPTPVPTPMPTMTPTPLPSPTPSPQPTPTIAFSNEPDSNSGSFLSGLVGNNSLVLGTVMAVITAGFLVLGVSVLTRVLARNKR